MGLNGEPGPKGGTVAKKRTMVFLALVAVLALVATACGGNDNKGPGGPTKGGFLRLQTDAYEWTGALDPTGEYLGFAFEFYNAMHRALFGYNYKEGAKGGNTPRPDLSKDEGQVSADGKTWTFTLKDGVKFAPPISRDVTSKDLVTAFNRLANPTLNATGYPSYYRDIVGFTDVEAGKSKTVSGVTAPTDKTFVIQLTRPVSELRYRLSMAATAPMPAEVADCFQKAGEYGRYQIATGPYMIKGSEALDKTSCATMKPISGFDPSTTNGSLHIVRNPNYDAGTDTKEMRENLIDGIDLTLNTNTDDIFKRIESGLADGESAQPPATVLSRFTSTADLKDNIHLDSGDRTWYLFMNMLKAPFDDLHVRRAANFVVDRAGLVRARGGTAAGVVAEHMIPPDVLGGLLKAGEFDPFLSPGHAGDVAKAKEEMKQSKYDTNKDGVCDAAVCRNVLHVTRSTPPYPDMAPIIEKNFSDIGIKLKTQQVASFYKTVQVPAQTPALGSGAGWGKDFASASTYFIPLLTSGAIGDTATQNYSYLGITKAQVSKLGFTRAKGYNPAGGTYPIDADVDACIETTPDKANQCWADLDKKTSTDYVPWVPYLWANNISVVSDAVTNYTYDQFAGEVSYVHIGIDTAKQKS
jgi:peptide/nickel transport system substrate-binding protein